MMKGLITLLLFCLPVAAFGFDLDTLDDDFDPRDLRLYKTTLAVCNITDSKGKMVTTAKKGDTLTFANYFIKTDSELVDYDVDINYPSSDSGKFNMTANYKGQLYITGSNKIQIAALYFVIPNSSYSSGTLTVTATVSSFGTCSKSITVN
ncbi:MAG: hypothetical protein K8I29_08750 [Alphaproteobacteria bacterium]|uniref:Uncharacterized protein n=1 Tax=Candidatus Nitrobium versatile TaxID=2884831 RepID=A0A953JCW1_9BACT|nr:hypothetical protein [Candidatus Nitrobium versatile]